MTGSTPFCPACGSAKIARRTPRGTDVDDPWACRECGREFDDPDRRDPDSHPAFGGLSDAGQAAIEHETEGLA